MVVRASVAIVLAVAVCATAAAQVPSTCARYSERGIRPGLTPQQVWAALGGRGDSEGEIDTPRGRVLEVRYTENDPDVVVAYDRTEISKKRGIVTTVRTTLGEAFAREPTRLLDRFGTPVEGAERLAAGLADGPAVWVDERCAVVVRVWYETAPWWDPSRGGFRIEIRDLDGAVAAGLVTPPTPAPREPDVDVAATGGATVAAGAAAGGASPPADGTAGEGAAPPRESVAGTGRRIPVVGVDDVVPPTRIEASYVPPFYPRPAFQAGVEGVVNVQVRLAATGEVQDVLSVEARPAGRGFEDAAVAAIRAWRYRPALRDGKPVEVVLPITVEFKARR